MSTCNGRDPWDSLEALFIVMLRLRWAVMRVNPKIFNLYDVFHPYNQTSNYNTLRILSSGNAMICNASIERNKSLYNHHSGNPTFSVRQSVWRFYPPGVRLKLGKQGRVHNWWHQASAPCAITCRSITGTLVGSICRSFKASWVPGTCRRGEGMGGTPSGVTSSG